MTARPRDAYIVMDVDWACDDVLAFTLDLIERLDIPVTMFITHATTLLDRLRASDLIELAIHPNFNDLLQGKATVSLPQPLPGIPGARQRVEELMRLVPEARSVRSHSLVHASWLMYVFADAGLTHEVNSYMPLQSGMELRAWRNWDGRLVRVPFLFEDSLQSFMPEGWSVERHLEQPGLRVLNFHPIRLFLNAHDAELPPDAAPSRQEAQRLLSLRHPKLETGSLTFLERFVEGHRERRGTFATISAIVPETAPAPRLVTSEGQPCR